MNSMEFDALQLRIVSYLKTKGPTTSETLAAQLEATHGNVRFALEQLRDRNDPLVNLLPFGLWDSADQSSVAA
jgi:hypothetical protein